MPDGHDVGDGQECQRRDDSAHRRLGRHQYVAAVEPVGQHAGHQQQRHVRRAVEEDDQAQLGGGVGDLQHQPPNDHELGALAEPLQ